MDSTIEIRTKDLLTIAVILDEFEDFSKNVIDLLKESKNIRFFYTLNKVIKGETVLGAKKIKDFYINNRVIVDVVNGYSDIHYFIAYNFDMYNKTLNEGTNNIYHYLLNNKDKIKNIIDSLIRIERLGFNTIYFNENFDFTNDIYRLSENPVLYTRFFYLDNLYAVPTYKNSDIKYKTKKSEYKMEMKTDMEVVEPLHIYLNTLLFDHNRLPEELDKKEIIDKILELKLNIKGQYDTLKESVDLSIGIDELKQRFEYVLNLSYMCDDLVIKKRLLSVLSDIKEELYELEYISNSYNKNIAQNYPTISEEKLKEEKVLELNRRKVN